MNFKTHTYHLGELPGGGELSIVVDARLVATGPGPMDRGDAAPADARQSAYALATMLCQAFGKLLSDTSVIRELSGALVLRELSTGAATAPTPPSPGLAGGSEASGGKSPVMEAETGAGALGGAVEKPLSGMSLEIAIHEMAWHIAARAGEEKARFARAFPDANDEMLDAVAAAYLTGVAATSGHLARHDGGCLPTHVAAATTHACHRLGLDRAANGAVRE